MTWKDFYAWLERQGVKYTPGDIHYEGRGWWFPQPPDLTRDVVAPKPPPPWLYVFKSGEDAVFIYSNLGGGEVTQFAEDPRAAKGAVEEKLMELYRAQDGLGGYGADDDVSSSCELGAHERCSDCGCGCHVSTRIFKRCGCGRSFVKEEWNALPLIGKQKVDADDEGPAVTYVARNCPCGSTLFSEEE